MEFQLEADRTDLRRGERRGSGLLSGGRDGRQWTIGNDKRVIGDGKPGPVTKKLMAEFQKVIFDPKNGTKI